MIKTHSIWGGLGKDASRLAGKETGQSMIVFAEGHVLHGLEAVAKLLWIDRRFFAASLMNILAWLSGDGVYEFVAKYRMRLDGVDPCKVVESDFRSEAASRSVIHLLAETSGDLRGLVFRTLRSDVIWRSDAAAEVLVSELDRVPASDHAPKLFGLPWEIGLGFCNYKHPKV
jgi:hypothetical protein